MINSVRNTVLAIVNKQNFGYITPADFNLYSKQAQLDIFEDVFYRYNQWVSIINSKRQGNEKAATDYADIIKNIEEVIDTFSVYVPLVNDTDSVFDIPSDYYLLNKLYYNNNREIERVSNGKIINLLSSNLTSPTVAYPAYILNGSKVTVYPTTITSNVSTQYIRKPKDPKWTYIEIGAGEPVFNQSRSDYQDFELPKAYEPELVVKILQYSGISIRENEVYNFSKAEESFKDQKQG
jgi:hypothetical protein